MNVIIVCSIILSLLNSVIQAKSEEEQNFAHSIFDGSRTFAKVMELVEQKHFNITNPEEAIIKAIDAFVTHLDPHSSFLDPKTYKAMLELTSGEFFGVGIVIDNSRKPKDKALTIVDILPDGPSDKSGIKPLDKIVEIDGKPLEGMSTEQVTSLLKGDRNTQVKIKVIRDNNQSLLSFTITRDIVKEQQSLSFHIKNHNIYYLSLSMFAESSASQIAALLNKANSQKYKGIILDLRNNSGGLVNAAVDIASLFLNKNSLVVVTKDRNGNELEKFSTTKDPIANNALPIFILINNYTASAAEILVGCLKIQAEQATTKKSGNPMVFLVGTKTFGKGSMQEVMEINNNCALKLTTALYYLSDNSLVQGVGIEPDFAVNYTLPPSEQMQWFTQSYGREETLQNYIKVADDNQKEKIKKNDIKNNNTEEKNSNRWQERVKKMLETDNQLRVSITLINTLQIAQKNMPKKIETRQDAIAYLQDHICIEELEIEEVKL
ncbi:MAG: S41 family peptidase [Candidatus Babeliales bacterium]